MSDILRLCLLLLLPVVLSLCIGTHRRDGTAPRAERER